jgi:HSP20 family protein
MSDVQAHTQNHADRPAGGSKRNDLASDSERRSFQEVSGQEGAGRAAGASRDAAGAAFDQARRELEQAVRRAPWTPTLVSRQLEPFLRMQGDMIRWFNEAWREGAGAWPLQRLGGVSAVPMFGLPAADIQETERAYKLSIELAGLRREDIDVAVQGEHLVVSGHKREDRQEAGTAWRLNERRYGRFERSFPLPPDVKRDAITAAFNDGVLSITLPRTGEAETAQRSTVQIKG